MKKQNKLKLLTTLAVCTLLAFMLTGCGSTHNNLNEGNCKCSVSMPNVPKEFGLMEDNLQNRLVITVRLQNVESEKYYSVPLNQENKFKQEISLRPGLYRVLGVSDNQSHNLPLDLKADQESVTLAPDTMPTIHVILDNPAEVTAHWMSIQPLPEMLLADKFDGKIQVNRQIFDLHASDSSALYAQLHIENDKQIAPYKKMDVVDSELGIVLTVQNQTEAATDWKHCKIVALHAKQNKVVFAQGVTLGMAPEKVCHKTDGLYGAPNHLGGSFLYGLQMDTIQAIYTDPTSGDKITMDLSAGGHYINSIKYELAQYED